MGFSFGFPVTEQVRAAVTVLAEAAVTAHFDGINVWTPAIESAGGYVRAAGSQSHQPCRPVRLAARDAADPAQGTPPPRRPTTFLDADGHRVTAFITDTPAGVVPNQLAGLDL